MKPLLKPIRLVGALGVLALLAACGGGEPATRSLSAASDLPQVSAPAVAPLWNVVGVSVDVPQSLHVSEANLYYPIADIVWRGEARGDRRAQVRAIFTDAATRATEGMHKGRPVTVDIEVTRFHAVTEKVRYTFGGTYSMKFLVTLHDAQTGEEIGAPRFIDASHPASGGQKAIDEEARGLTQKVVVTDFLSKAIAAELARPVSAQGEAIASAQ